MHPSFKKLKIKKEKNIKERELLQGVISTAVMVMEGVFVKLVTR